LRVLAGPPRDLTLDDRQTKQQLQIWDVAHARLLQTSIIPGLDAQLSSDGQMLAAFDTVNDGGLRGIRFTRVADGRVLYEDEQALFGDFRMLEWVTLSADGMTAAYATTDGQVHVIDLARGSTRMRAFPAYRLATFSPDGRMLAAVQGEVGVTLWRMDDRSF